MINCYHQISLNQKELPQGGHGDEVSMKKQTADFLSVVNICHKQASDALQNFI